MGDGATLTLRDPAGREYRVQLGSDGRVVVDGEPHRVQQAIDGSFLVEGSPNVIGWGASSGDTRWVFVDGQVFTFESASSARRRSARSGHHGALAAPMPATVRKINVAAGSAEQRGDVLVVLEAMTMELPIRASEDAVVAAVNCQEGELVQPGQELVTMEGL